MSVFATSAPRKLPDLLKDVDELPRVQSKYMSRMPYIAAFCGSTGSGKTYLAISHVKMQIKEGSINRLYIISPTARQNPLLKAVYQEDNPNHFMFEDCSNRVFETLNWIEQDMEAQAEMWADALVYEAAYKRFRLGAELKDHEEYLLESNGFRKPNTVRPKALLLLDDVQSTAVLSARQANPFTNLVLKSRWLGSGLGCSILMLTQTYKSNAVPRALRLNLTHLAVFRTQNKEEIKNIYQEVGSFVSQEQFEQLFTEYTAPKHGYMFVDFINKRITNSF